MCSAFRGGARPSRPPSPWIRLWIVLLDHNIYLLQQFWQLYFVKYLIFLNNF